MSFASFMVSVDLGDSARARIRLAGHLADAFGARLIGVAAEMPAYAAAPIGPTLGGAYCLATAEEAVLKDLRTAHAIFDAESAGRSRVEWRSNLDIPVEFLARQAPAADLAIVGRGEAGGPLPAVDPGDALMRLGIPLLVVPPGVDRCEARRVAVGWKSTREAHRTVRDALPFLRRASHVSLLTVPDGGGAAETRDILGLLEAHDVPVHAVRREADGATTAEALIDAACEDAADLIVAGGYGHGRLAEWIFGGVTRELLAGCPVCCLMSH